MAAANNTSKLAPETLVIAIDFASTRSNALIGFARQSKLIPGRHGDRHFKVDFASATDEERQAKYDVSSDLRYHRTARGEFKPSFGDSYASASQAVLFQDLKLACDNLVRQRKIDTLSQSNRSWWGGDNQVLRFKALIASYASLLVTACIQNARNIYQDEFDDRQQHHRMNLGELELHLILPQPTSWSPAARSLVKSAFAEATSWSGLRPSIFDQEEGVAGLQFAISSKVALPPEGTVIIAVDVGGRSTDLAGCVIRAGTPEILNRRVALRPSGHFRGSEDLDHLAIPFLKAGLQNMNQYTDTQIAAAFRQPRMEHDGESELRMTIDGVIFILPVGLINAIYDSYLEPIIQAIADILFVNHLFPGENPPLNINIQFLGGLMRNAYAEQQLNDGVHRRFARTSKVSVESHADLHTVARGALIQHVEARLRDKDGMDFLSSHALGFTFVREEDDQDEDDTQPPAKPYEKVRPEDHEDIIKRDTKRLIDDKYADLDYGFALVADQGEPCKVSEMQVVVKHVIPHLYNEVNEWIDLRLYYANIPIKDILLRSGQASIDADGLVTACLTQPIIDVLEQPCIVYAELPVGMLAKPVVPPGPNTEGTPMSIHLRNTWNGGDWQIALIARWEDGPPAGHPLEVHQRWIDGAPSLASRQRRAIFAAREDIDSPLSRNWMRTVQKEVEATDNGKGKYIWDYATHTDTNDQPLYKGEEARSGNARGQKRKAGVV